MQIKKTIVLAEKTNSHSFESELGDKCGTPLITRTSLRLGREIYQDSDDGGGGGGGGGGPTIACTCSCSCG